MANDAKGFDKDMKKLMKTLNKLVKDAQKAALKPLAQAIKDDAPVDSGQLKKGIKIKAGPRRKGFIITQVEIKTSDDNPHAARVELGTKDMKADPFIRPKVKEMRDKIIEEFKQELDKRLGNL